ncbi:hypothetical protein SDC9_90684 [bioreactor metagenome]|uniref:Uncharacterized protein n=1 Tax=bioreactor metagenome TaxID=1076179 RepID=A0A644ZTD9_9ZZZZ
MTDNVWTARSWSIDRKRQNCCGRSCSQRRTPRLYAKNISWDKTDQCIAARFYCCHSGRRAAADAADLQPRRGGFSFFERAVYRNKRNLRYGADCCGHRNAVYYVWSVGGNPTDSAWRPRHHDHFHDPVFADRQKGFAA